METTNKSAEGQAEDFFFKKFGNKITAIESWAIRFAVEFSASENAKLKDENESNKRIINAYFETDKTLQAEIERLRNALEEIRMNFVYAGEEKISGVTALKIMSDSLTPKK